MNNHTSIKMGNLQEIDKFLERYNLSRLNQGETENMNRPINSDIIKSVQNKQTKKNKTLPPNKMEDQRASQVNSTKHLMKS